DTVRESLNSLAPRGPDQRLVLSWKLCQLHLGRLHINENIFVVCSLCRNYRWGKCLPGSVSRAFQRASTRGKAAVCRTWIRGRGTTAAMTGRARRHSMRRGGPKHVRPEVGFLRERLRPW